LRKNTKEQEDLPKGKLNKEGFQQIKYIYGYVWPYKGVFLLGLLFLVLSTITSLAFPALIGPLIDTSQSQATSFLQKYFPNMPIFGIKQVMMILGGILLFQGIFSFFRVLTFAHVSQNAMADIRKELFAKLITLPFPFFEENRVGALVSRITSDVGQLEETLSWTLAEFFRQIITFFGGAIFIALISPKLALVMLSTFPAIVIGAVVFGRFIRKLSKKTQEVLAESNVIVEESLHNIKVVKSFTNEKFETNRYNPGIDQMVKYAISTAKYRAFFNSFVVYGIFGGIIMVLWFGVSYVDQGLMSIGDLVSFVIFTAYIGGAVGGIGDIYSRLQKAVGATERIREIVDEPKEVSLESSENIRLKGDISYQNVDFSYPTRKDIQILENLSFDIQRGQKIALVGASGSGKSTIAQLLLRLYDLQGGEILIDGKSIEEYNVTALRKNVGIVPQDVILFGGTIKENILYGNPDAADAEVLEAAKQANAWEFIKSFPEQLDTIVGERGVKLSGGQRQRIAIARAILKNPSILILDEATSSLDSESEKLVQDALNKLLVSRTSIIIAHRLSTIREADRILVIEHGKIIEQGTHESLLLSENGVYKGLLELQMELS